MESCQAVKHFRRTGKWAEQSSYDIKLIFASKKYKTTQHTYLYSVVIHFVMTNLIMECTLKDPINLRSHSKLRCLTSYILGHTCTV